MRKFPAFRELVGETLKSVTIDEDNGRVLFETITGETYALEHLQDCCESVYIESIVGNISDLLDTPITLAEESSQDAPKADYDSATWTFYKLATVKGYVDIRWLGESNGYYSESVDFLKLMRPGEEDS